MTKTVIIEEFEVSITRVIEHIPLEMLELVIENWKFRIDHVSRIYGQYLKGIIFKN